ncbi:hypothetical protein SAY86_016503 [Trapa natans]|uniref:Uncharacterized protein n=1 Tax=Trapa natans TaxID=22666 RepID=A0AAN7QZI6_TRANT|nr:hypothetical protein SAY86_016503 [Trapa natans]
MEVKEDCSSSGGDGIGEQNLEKNRNVGYFNDQNQHETLQQQDLVKSESSARSMPAALQLQEHCLASPRFHKLPPGSYDHSIKVWDTNTTQVVMNFKMHGKEGIHHSHVSPGNISHAHSCWN